ncbi:MAG: class I SAM-dependent methyltransferase [bacterium]|nr:class I SAM-dependent methyltransferase [bacterium]
MKKQVEKQAYNFKKYCDQDRWLSYWRQIDEILKLNPASVLEVGAGDRTLSSYLKNNTDIDYQCVDIAEDLKPDIISSVDNLKLPDNSCDMVCAFEVLEHLPFEKFKKSLSELKRVSKRYVIISLPHWGRHFSIDARLPYFKRLRWQYKFNLFPIKHKFDGQHYWEIGERGYSLKIIKIKIKEADFKIVKNYIALESPYHHFFVLEK